MEIWKYSRQKEERKKDSRQKTEGQNMPKDSID